MLGDLEFIVGALIVVVVKLKLHFIHVFLSQCSHSLTLNRFFLPRQQPSYYPQQRAGLERSNDGVISVFVTVTCSLIWYSSLSTAGVDILWSSVGSKYYAAPISIWGVVKSAIRTHSCSLPFFWNGGQNLQYHNFAPNIFGKQMLRDRLCFQVLRLELKVLCL